MRLEVLIITTTGRGIDSYRADKIIGSCCETYRLPQTYKFRCCGDHSQAIEIKESNCVKAWRLATAKFNCENCKNKGNLGIPLLDVYIQLLVPKSSEPDKRVCDICGEDYTFDGVPVVIFHWNFRAVMYGKSVCQSCISDMSEVLNALCREKRRLQLAKEAEMHAV